MPNKEQIKGFPPQKISLFDQEIVIIFSRGGGNGGYRPNSVFLEGLKIIARNDKGGQSLLLNLMVGHEGWTTKV